MEEYYLSLSFGGDIWKIQREIESILGECNGSGFCFVDGKRDLSYDFTDKRSLFSAVRKVRRMPRRIKCKAWDTSVEDWKKISLRNVR